MFRLPPDCVEPAFQAVLNYWESKRASGAVPLRRDVDPLDLPANLLPQLLLFDVVEDKGEMRFRLRLAGTAFTRLAGRDVTNLFFDELGPVERTTPVLDLLKAVVAQQRPGYLSGLVTVRDRAHEDVLRLALPLSAEPGKVDKVLGIWAIVPLPDAKAPANPLDGVVQMLEEA